MGSLSELRVHYLRAGPSPTTLRMHYKCFCEYTVSLEEDLKFQMTPRTLTNGFDTSLSIAKNLVLPCLDFHHILPDKFMF